MKAQLFKIPIFVFILEILLQVNLGNGLNSDKIPSSELRLKLSTNKTPNIIITFDIQTEETVSHVREKLRSIKSRVQKFHTITQALADQAGSSQTKALEILKTDRSTKYRVLWITNQIYIYQATEQLINKLAELNHVTLIEEDNLELSPDLPQTADENSLKIDKRPPHPKYGRLTWGIENMKVPEVWDQGYFGQNLIVANIDGGTFFHDANRDNFIGLDNFGIYVPLLDSYLPTGQGPHGTHTMGTIAGHLGIGVAPGAKWMACQFSAGQPNDELYNSIIRCFQHFLCPGRGNSSENMKCGTSPHVISNSWELSKREMNSSLSKGILSAIQAFEGTGTHVVFAVGNEGPNCTTVGYPSNLPFLLGVGALNITNQVAFFSNSGPGFNGSMKPDIVVPGVGIVSTVLNEEFMSWMGTSMACPHAAGVVALMLSKNPDISSEQIMEALHKSAEPTAPHDGQIGRPCRPNDPHCHPSVICEAIPLDTYPNYRAGYGRVNALKAVNFIPHPK